ncbi:MFS transporter [Kribbella shirazensis]|uniref:EmrB/QacA subfamily drug resistance transporter n=1 Tax=Kribbella shirazensis TaxID=1105143 RepID=A0A7X5VIP1_9ACTN|nr:MFS transporter [Kribbella shirazensis]NIK61975.1 EmrB/QacA subfamily drug resistance transporter [Kribbella shirazensis]
MRGDTVAGDRPPVEGNRWWLVVAVGLAVFMAMLDMSIVGIALPSIEADFDASPAAAEWVVLGYLLPLVGVTLPVGPWLDQVGKRSALVFSTTGFVVAGVAAGLAPNLAWLVGARIVQGSFGAILFALGPALAALAVRPEARGRALSVVATVGPLGGVTGPVLGGFLVDNLGWPWTFYLNVPVGLVVVGIGLAQLRADGPLRRPELSMVAEVAVLGTAALALLGGLALSAGRGLGWLALGLAGLPLLYLWLRMRASQNVRRLLRTRAVGGPHLALVAQTTAVGALVFLTPFYLQNTLRMSATTAGLAMLAFPLATLLVAPVAGALADAWSTRRTALSGVALFVVGLLATAPLNPDWGAVDLAWRLAVVGAGAGLFSGPNQSAVMSSAPRELLATAGATTSLARQLGFSLGPGLATTTWAVSGYTALGMRTAMVIAAVLGALALLCLSRDALTPEQPEPVRVTH